MLKLFRFLEKIFDQIAGGLFKDLSLFFEDLADSRDKELHEELRKALKEPIIRTLKG